jgi:hypothetical protein
MMLGRQQHWADDRWEPPRYLDDLSLNVEPGERIGPPLPSRYKAILRRTLLCIALIAGVWAVATDEGGPDSWVTQAKSLAATAIANVQQFAARPTQDAAPAASDMAGASAELGTPGQSAQQSSATELPPMLTQTPIDDAGKDADASPPTEAMGTAYSEKAEPAEDAQDKSPARKRAVAAGLGPDLPNVLLTRLSKADLENAAYAIKTAIAKIPDDASFAWPPATSRKQAYFEVRFVQGAAQGCRRYIVKVTKDRWSSTSAALEKCESGPAPAG